MLILLCVERCCSLVHPSALGEVKRKTDAELKAARKEYPRRLGKIALDGTKTAISVARGSPQGALKNGVKFSKGVLKESRYVINPEEYGIAYPRIPTSNVRNQNLTSEQRRQAQEARAKERKIQRTQQQQKQAMRQKARRAQLQLQRVERERRLRETRELYRKQTLERQQAIRDRERERRRKQRFKRRDTKQAVLLRKSSGQ